MKNTIRFFILLLSIFQYSHGQNNQSPDPCHWSYSVEQTKPGEAMLIITAKLDSGWHLYSQNIDDGGPIPTKFTFTTSADFNLDGKTEEGTPHKEYDPNFDMQLLYFENESVFKQKIKVEGKKDFTISGTIDYMVCLEQCIFPPAAKFTFNIKGNSTGGVKEN